MKHTDQGTMSHVKMNNAQRGAGKYMEKGYAERSNG